MKYLKYLNFKYLGLICIIFNIIIAMFNFNILSCINLACSVLIFWYWYYKGKHMYPDFLPILMVDKFIEKVKKGIKK